MSSEHDDCYVEELRVVRRAKGTHRSKSRTTPGYDRDLLRDEEDLRGPSESRPATAADVEEHLGVRPWELDSERSEVELTPGQRLGATLVEVAAEVIGNLASDPEMQELAGEAWKKLKAGVLDRRAKRREVRNARIVAQLEAMEWRPETAPPELPDDIVVVVAEPPSEGVSAEEYAELLRVRLLARLVAEQAEARLNSVHVQDDDQLPAELRAAHQAALTADLQDLDPRTLELLGFTRESHGVLGAVQLLEPQPPRELRR